MSIKSNLESVKSTLNQDTTLVCVSKYHTEEEIMEAYNEGVRDFGENKVQDMVKKAENLPSDIRWHLIGHLQTNKVKYIVGKTYLVQSVDRIELAEELNKRFEKSGLICDCLIQINSTGIDSRFGCTPETATAFAEKLKEFKNLNVKGIMGMAPICDDPTENFKLLKDIFDNLTEKGLLNGNILSMGMSDDYAFALKCGSNMVRIGSKIFNQEDKK